MAPRRSKVALSALLLAGCSTEVREPGRLPEPAAGSAAGAGGNGSVPAAPASDPGDILDTTLAIDLDAGTGVATLTFVPSQARESLEVGDLVIRSVRSGETALDWTRTGTQLELALPASEARLPVTFEYDWRVHDRRDGISSGGQSYTWPYFCGNVFPCRSAPKHGSTFHLSVSGGAAPHLAPALIPSDAPSYMLAWNVGWQRQVQLGTTGAGTRVSVWRSAGDADAAALGTAHLVAAFDWLEQHVGAYRFGSDVGSMVEPRDVLRSGGIEHHPYWQVASTQADEEPLHVHEAAHGWFGNGVRLRCWEDFVLSEGTASYLAARALEEVAGRAVSDPLWEDYASQARGINNDVIAWPESCGQIDILDAGLQLTSRAAYAKGALFLRALEERVGRDAFDRALRSCYERWAGKAAGMQDLLDVMQELSGYDPTACARDWLRQGVRPPQACP